MFEGMHADSFSLSPSSLLLACCSPTRALSCLLAQPRPTAPSGDRITRTLFRKAGESQSVSRTSTPRTGRTRSTRSLFTTSTTLLLEAKSTPDFPPRRQPRESLPPHRPPRPLLASPTRRKRRSVPPPPSPPLLLLLPRRRRVVPRKLRVRARDKALKTFTPATRGSRSG